MLATGAVCWGLVDSSVYVKLVILETPLIDDDICREDCSFDVFGEPDMGQHGDGWSLGLDLLHEGELLHVRNTIDHRIDLPFESIAMLEGPLASPNFDLPVRIEEVGAW